MGQGLWRCEHSTQLLMSQVRALAAAQDITASSWPLKPSRFKSGSQNPQAGPGKRKADIAKWYLQRMSYIYPSFFSSSFWKSHLWGFILCSASALCATLPPLLSAPQYLRPGESYESRKFMNSQKVTALKNIHLQCEKWFDVYLNLGDFMEPLQCRFEL